MFSKASGFTIISFTIISSFFVTLFPFVVKVVFLVELSDASVW